MTCTAPLTEKKQVSTKGYILTTFQITRGWEGREDNAKGAEGGGEGRGEIKTVAIHYISYLQEC